MKNTATLFKSKIFKSVFSVCIIALSTTAYARFNTCGIGYISILQNNNYWAYGSPKAYAKLLIHVDNTGFVPPSFTPLTTLAGGKKVISVWWTNEKSEYYHSFSKLAAVAQASRIPVRIGTNGTDCKGWVTEFDIMLCTNAEMCNTQSL